MTEVNRNSRTPYNFAVVEDANVSVDLELNSPQQQNDVEHTAPPKLGYMFVFFCTGSIDSFLGSL